MGVICLFATDQAIGLPASLPSIQPASLHGKNLNAEHYMQLNFVKPAVHMGLIDFYHFIPCTKTLTLAVLTRSAESRAF